MCTFPRGITKPPRVWRYEVGHFHIVDLVLRLAVRSVLPAENHICDQSKPVTVTGATMLGIFMSWTSKKEVLTGAIC